MSDNNQLLELLSNKKVLYAEDEKGIQNNVVKILKLYFDNVITASNGEEALDEYIINKPDVVILDICMPHIDGLEVVKKIREDNKKIPIIILSAYTDNEYLWRAVEQKICKYLTKPFKKDQFIEALKTVSLELSNYETKVKIAQGYYNPFNKIFTIKEKEIQLSINESKMLDYLLSKVNQTVTYEELFDYIWIEDEFPSKDALKALIKDLRKIIGKETIKNIFGVGYKLEV
ncbi:response regulator transcription factor [Halarcobacter anaerophilus]|jgi:DNA-binding response OmpR family regulator|uniref:response regulator transcription factor n=1 Tax=Halarcobacter anaerophilus TaxID=877500 RepID=UPI0005C7ED53|nr:response regulator transcription factor [Halarcobacter anaerophilus]